MWAICNNLRYNFRDNNFKIEYLNKWTDIYERVKVGLFLPFKKGHMQFLVILKNHNFNKG